MLKSVAVDKRQKRTSALKSSWLSSAQVLRFYVRLLCSNKRGFETFMLLLIRNLLIVDATISIEIDL